MQAANEPPIPSGQNGMPYTIRSPVRRVGRERIATHVDRPGQYTTPSNSRPRQVGNVVGLAVPFWENAIEFHGRPDLPANGTTRPVRRLLRRAVCTAIRPNPPTGQLQTP